MVARVTEQLMAAIDALRCCKRTPYNVALALGISTSTIYRSPHFAELVEQLTRDGKSIPAATDPAYRLAPRSLVNAVNAAPSVDGKKPRSMSAEVHAAIRECMSTGKTPYEVAPKYNVSHSSIYRSWLYRQWKRDTGTKPSLRDLSHAPTPPLKSARKTAIKRNSASEAIQ